MQKQAAIVMIPKRMLTVPGADYEPGLLAVTNRKYGDWGLPGGRQEDGEHIRATAKRELYEETGCIVSTSDLVFLTKGPGVQEPDRIVHVFWARVYVGKPRNKEEGTQVDWMSWRTFLQKTSFKKFYEENFPDGIEHLQYSLQGAGS